MKHWKLSLAAAVTLGVSLAGCGQTTSPAPASATGDAASGSQSRPVADRSHSYVYVADYTHSLIDVYPEPKKNPEPVTSIVQGISLPIGIAIGASGTLYVANAGDPASVTEYPAGSTSPSVTLTQGIVSPDFVAVDGAGDVWVSNTGLPGNIVEYPPGSYSPTTTLTNGVSDPTGLAFDSAGDLLVANNNGTGQGSVAVFPPGASQPSTTFGGGTISDPLGVTVDRHGDIYVTDFILGEVFVFAKKSYKLIRTIPNNSSYGLVNPVATTIAADARTYVSLGDVSEVYEFSKLGKKWPPLSAIIEKGLTSAWGIAADPAIAP